MTLKINFERYLNIRSAYSPAWLDGGQRVAFLTDITGTPQVWAVDINGGWPEQLTFFKEKVWTLHTAPGGKQLVCSRDTGGNERYQLYLVSSDGSEVNRISLDINAIYHFGAWSADGDRIAYTSNERNGTHFDVYIQEVPSGSRTLVHQTTGNFRILGWSPDGANLILANEIGSAHIRLYLLDVESRQTKILTPADEPGVNLQARWINDHEIIFLTNQGREYLTPAKLNTTNGSLIYPFAEQPLDVEGLTLSKDGIWAAIITKIDGYARLRLGNLEKGTQSEVNGLPDGIVGEAVFSPGGGKLAVSVQSPQENLNIWVIEFEAEPLTARKLTQSSKAGIPQDSFIKPDLIHFDTFDRRSIPAFFYKPRQMKKLPACILYVHGGPASQVLADFDPRFQYFLNQGYAILAPNVRGSSGYGKTYMALDDIELRMDSVADLKYAVEWLRGSGEVDPARIAIYGRSYGGFMVLSAITTYPDLWAAAVDVVGIANWVTFLENTGPWRRAHREKEYGSLEADRAFLQSISPIHQVDRIQCPLLVIHGANDPRVPVSEADQIVASLQAREHPVEYLRYEDEGHKIAKLPNRIDSFTKMADFLDRYLN
jgi:dipeptidyl aminopeptidase/acylaminoacyl peptidase